MARPEQVWLSSRVTVENYRSLEMQRKRDDLARFVEDRFVERYVSPIEATPADAKSGFVTLAVCCLLIETLESFWRGWGTSRNKERQAFRSFFARHRSLESLRDQNDFFYESIRCGLVHQAEVRDGWRVGRRGPLVDHANRRINATRLLRVLRVCIGEYAAVLREEEWHSGVWRRFRAKMAAICRNCERRRLAEQQDLFQA